MKIFIAGDSTAESNVNSESVACGWGHVLNEYFNESVYIDNRAKGGRSTKSFIEEKLLNEIIEDSHPGDYMFVQFGHNDKKEGDRRTEPFTTYAQNLRLFIERAEMAEVYPVLLTPIHRRKFDDNGVLVNTHGDYPAAMRMVAAELNVPLIDMSEISENLLNKLGVDESKKIFLHFKPNEYPEFPDGVEDNSHFSRYGSNRICELIAIEISKKVPKLAKYLL